jgi:hypothetical protein
MKYIAHRGNTHGRSLDLENRPSYISDALHKGYDAEIDVWHLAGRWFLGHDEAEHDVGFEFLKQKGLWLHCKNLAALDHMIQAKDEILGQFFWHENDMVTLTSGLFIWTFPGRPIVPKRSIVVHPELIGDWKDAAGICSDHVARYVNL